MKSNVIQTPLLKSYANFLFQYHLVEMRKYFFKKNEESNLFQFKERIDAPEKELIDLLEIELELFLKSIINKKVLKCVKTFIIDFEINKYPFIQKHQASDLLLFYHNIKLTLLHFLPKYTDDLNQAVDIVNEIETIYGPIENLIFHGVRDYDVPEREMMNESENEVNFKESQFTESQRIAIVGSFDWNLFDDVIILTHEAYKIFNLSTLKKQFTFSELKPLLKSEDAIKLEDKLRKALHGKTHFEGEFKIINDLNLEKIIVVKAKILYNKIGHAVRILGTILDISNLKKTEEELKKKNQELQIAYTRLEETQQDLWVANSELELGVLRRTQELRESEEKYHTFIKQSSEGIWRYELEGIPYIDINSPIEEQIHLILNKAYIAECNDKMAEIHGFDSPEDFIGTKVNDFLLYPDEVKAEIIKGFILSNYRLTDVETIELGKKGNVLHIQSSIVGMVEDNKLLRGWGTQRDITERVHSRTALMESESRYRFLAENVPEIFWTTDKSGYTDFYNQKWYEYTGSTFEESKGLGWKAFIHPDDTLSYLKGWSESFRTGAPYQQEYRIKRKDGKYRWHLVRALPLKDENEKIIKWMGTSTDIDEQKNISEELKQKNDELMWRNNDLDNFIYTASHDLKAPIANIEGLLNTLGFVMQDICKEDEEIKEILDMMSNSINKFKKTILDLTEITLAQRSGEEAIQENQIEELFDEARSMVEDIIKTNNAKIITDFTDCPTIKFSRKNIRSILFNLLSNAIKYRSPERTPEINITSHKLPDFVLLTVKDNGLGFDTSQLEKAFSMFRRLHSHTEGSGIGLYIVKRIITNSGGKIEVKSDIGKGSEFKIYLKPLA